MSRELNRGRVGEVLSLPRNSCLDNSSKEHADGAEHREAESDNQNYRCATITATRDDTCVIAAANDQATDEAQDHDAEQHAHEPDIKAHITIQNVAELVCDNALQLVALQ